MHPPLAPPTHLQLPGAWLPTRRGPLREDPAQRRCRWGARWLGRGSSWPAAAPLGRSTRRWAGGGTGGAGGVLLRTVGAMVGKQQQRRQAAAQATNGRLPAHLMQGRGGWGGCAGMMQSIWLPRAAAAEARRRTSSAGAAAAAGNPNAARVATNAAAAACIAARHQRAACRDGARGARELSALREPTGLCGEQIQ